MSDRPHPVQVSASTYSLLWDRILDTTFRVVTALAAQRSIPPQDRDDLRQEAYLRVFRSMDRFDPTEGDASIATWIFTHAQGTVLDHLRRTSRRLPSVQVSEDPEEAPTEDPNMETPLEAAERREKEAALEDCIQALPDRIRERYRARFPESGPRRNRGQAASLMGLSEDTMRDSLRTAVELLLECMRRKGHLPRTDGDGGNPS